MHKCIFLDTDKLPVKGPTSSDSGHSRKQNDEKSREWVVESNYSFKPLYH